MCSLPPVNPALVEKTPEVSVSAAGVTASSSTSTSTSTPSSSSADSSQSVSSSSTAAIAGSSAPSTTSQAATISIPASAVPNVKLHANVQPLSRLLGVWRGVGEGSYPNISPFSYTEELAFLSHERPFIFYTQRTWDKSTQTPLHVECGYIRAPKSDGKSVELLISQPSGIQESHSGNYVLSNTADGVEHKHSILDLEFKSTHVVSTATVKHPLVQAVQRKFRLIYDDEKKEDKLEYSLDMTTETTANMTHHIKAILWKVH